MFCRDKYLKKGLKLAKFKDQLRIRYHSETENATVAHRYTQEDAKEERRMTRAFICKYRGYKFNRIFRVKNALKDLSEHQN